MEALVFRSGKEDLYTTSDVIAKFAGVQHHTITRLIQQHEEDFKDFGILRFEIEEIKGRGQPAKHYALNEQQATLLMTYLKNTPNVRAFKKELVRQFFAMREELNRAKVSHAAKNAIRRAMTDALNEHIPDGPHKGHQIGNYTDLTYKLVFGKSAKKMREELGLKRKESVVPYMTSVEMDAVAKAEELVAVLTNMGLSYHQVKDCLLLGIVPAIAKKAE